ncbi:hypothetical protein L228DRAFT_249775 [Xylona heveae TC161]|uniref:Uncharacterized protein n=1 Tax=Xylona heveae (strain CBS 132557 / TC161) TaxID=1328760 RepID=A0A165FG19_XYLHT|nr:hypothetical protein L228DRAFT_249775 [Xylona heveae TC161]KZF20934.1 hypothetical protein L228DRAFT_249775 [Xylona heveae TC161]
MELPVRQFREENPVEMRNEKRPSVNEEPRPRGEWSLQLIRRSLTEPRLRANRSLMES